MGIAAHWRYRGCPLGGVLSTRQNDQGGRVSGCSGRSKGMATAKGNIDRRLRSYRWQGDRACRVLGTLSGERFYLE
jgi:hypothetical protein